MKFLGIDLGWSSGASGLCCLGWRDEELELLDLKCLTEIPEILDWVDGWLPVDTPGMIAVDAPTLIPNQTGMRLCDRQSHQYFGRYHAGCYPANLNLSFAQRTVGFGLSLLERGFKHGPRLQPQELGRYQIEVFPHAASLYLFNLTQIIKYKKGKLADRQQGLARLRQCLLETLPIAVPPLPDLQLPPIPTKGSALKDLEDRLDSLICAYIAAHWWYWGLERNCVLGGMEATGEGWRSPTLEEFCARGYIIVPYIATQRSSHLVP
jgi:predicted RNase H-like nuclease